MPRWTVVVSLSLSMAVAGVGWGYAQQQKAAAMFTPQDYNEIQSCTPTYSQTLDKGQGDLFAATFTPDGEFTSGRPAGRGNDTRTPLKGTEALRRMGSVGGGRHFTANLVITQTPEGASGVLLPFVVQRPERAGDDHRDRHLSGHAGQDPAGLALQQARRLAR